jgi:hypothetical protein
LRGDAFQTMSFVDGARARAAVPGELDFVWRAGGIYYGSYRAGSSLQYNELIVVQGLVRKGGRFGFWISQIYVDDEAALAGGHEIWDLPKQLARFEVATDAAQRTTEVRVTGASGALCRLRVQRNRWALPQTVTWPMIAGARRAFSPFRMAIDARLALCRVDVDIPQESPLAQLGLEKPFAALGYERALITANAPERAP